MKVNPIDRAVDPRPDPFQQYSATETRYLIAHIAGALTRKHEAVIALRYREGLTFAEIGKRLKITKESAFGLHERATKLIEERLKAMRVRFHDLI